jgi:hypothetical protein
MSRPPGHGRGRRALALGVALALVYLAGAVLTGRANPLVRRPLLDGLAPPSPYRWVHPPAGLAAGNKPPAAGRFPLKLTATGSELSAFSTPDGQVQLVLSQGAVPASSGQTGVLVTVQPLDPARLAAPSGLVVAGNAYRIQAAYRPSGRKVRAFGGNSSVGLVYPLLSAPIGNPAGHVVLASADGHSWSPLASTDTPGSHLVSAPLHQAGYVAVGVPPGAATAGGRSRTAVLLAATAVAGLLVVGALVARRFLAGRFRPGGRRPGGGPPRGSRTDPAGRDHPGPRPAPPGRRHAKPARRRRRR